MEQVWMPPGPELTDLAAITGKIKKKHAYFDHVRVWFDTEAPPGTEARLRNLCGGGVKSSFVPMELYTTRAGKKIASRQWLSSWELFQPTNAAFTYLRAQTQGRSLINYVEITLDWITDTLLEAEELQEFLESHLIKPWHGQRPFGRYRTSLYYGERPKGGYTNLLCYSDKPSRMTGDPCCHVEWRLQGRTRVKNNKHVEIATFEDLLAFDHYTFWKTHLVLRDITSLERIGKAFLGQTRRKKPLLKTYRGLPPFNWDVRAGSLLLRGWGRIPWKTEGIKKVQNSPPLAKENPGRQPALFSVQALLLQGREVCDVTTCLKKISNDAFLPSPRRTPLSREPGRPRLQGPT
jgi:hypothetical protein